jgi:NAD(P)-dependent dehydrogenase (short-subunit alcohol dehydrogenase family)
MPQEKTQQSFPPQTQEPPGDQSEMTPPPKSMPIDTRGTGRLMGKTALITGGDSGIGRAVAVAFAREGANSAIVYLSEHDDAAETCRLVKQEGAECQSIAGDIGDSSFCADVVSKTIDQFGRIDILVNNAAEQHPTKNFAEITDEQLEKTFRTNIFAMFYLTRAALPHLAEGATIINSTSVTAYQGSAGLVDYASTKGAIVAFTRSLALNLVERKIRVNAVAPGPIWTPLIVSTFDEQHVKTFGQDVPMKRAGEPNEVATCYVFLASDDASYMTGQVLHPNGGTVVNG